MTTTTLATRTPGRTYAPELVTGWQAITLHQHDDMPVQEARDAITGEPVGTVCQWTPGRWQVQRLHPAYTPATCDTPDGALSAVDWLLCVPAGMLADSLASHPRTVIIVLADGTTARADEALISAGGATVTFRVDAVGPVVDLASRAPMGDVTVGDDLPAGAYGDPRCWITYGSLDPVALAPACEACESLPGEPCHPYAHPGTDL